MPTKLAKGIFFILFALSVSIHGQTPGFRNFIKLFPKRNLPVCIQYADKEFDIQKYVPEEEEMRDSIAKDKIITYKNTILAKSDSLELSYELVKTYLLADSETVTLYWPNDYPDTMHPVYYVNERLLTDKNFFSLIYERQFSDGSGNPYAYKYLCTLSAKGKLIDKVVLASAEYSGTGILGSGFRVPWFPDNKSCINKDLVITFTGNDEHVVIYKIDDKGKIHKRTTVK